MYASTGENKAGYLTQVQKAADFLLNKVKDNTYGGYIYGFYPNGTWYTGNWPYDNLTGKDSLGHGQIILGLTAAYQATGNVNYLNGAYAAWNALDTKLRDPTVPGGIYYGMNRTFTALYPGSQPGINMMMHIFEPMCTLYSVTHDPAIKTAAEQLGDCILTYMYHDGTAPNEGFIADTLNTDWTLPADKTHGGTGQVNMGHNMEMTYLLSRAVQMGLKSDNPDAWLAPAQKVQNFVLDHAYDASGNGGIYTNFDYSGNNLDAHPVKDEWEQCETLRALAHWATYHPYRSDLWQKFDQTLAMVKVHLIDNVWGSWRPYYDCPDGYTRGDYWGGGYHESMMYSEILRISGMPNPGDTDGDGYVNGDDFVRLAVNYTGTGATGKTGPTATSTATATWTATTSSPWPFTTPAAPPVPEPASLCLLAAGALGLLRRR